MLGSVPGQRKRKRREREDREQAAVRFAPEAGHWDVLFETQDDAEFRAHLRSLRAGNERIDWSAVRVDTLCGRSTHPTTYRLSVFVPTTDHDDL